jgi:cation transport ATPase
MNKQLRYRIAFDNCASMRPEAKSVIKHFQSVLHKKVHILSGDAVKTVRAIAKRLGVAGENVVGGADATTKRGVLLNLRSQV